MFRDRSKSKLSSASSKSKIKQTIRVAMGKKPLIQIQKIGLDPKKRSSSTKSLVSYQHSQANLNNYQNYAKTNRNSTQNLLASVNKYNSSQADLLRIQEKVIIQQALNITSYEWWHENQYKIQSQSKISEAGSKKTHMKYYAYSNPQSLKKHILIAIQNTTLYIGDPEITIYLINSNFKTIQSINSKLDKIQLKGNDITEILVVGCKQEEFKEEKYQKSITSGAKCNPKLEKFILEQIVVRKNNFFQLLTRKTIQQGHGNKMVQFYLCIHLQSGSHNTYNQMSQKIIINSNTNSNRNSKIINEVHDKKKIFIETLTNIKISEQALLRYRK